MSVHVRVCEREPEGGREGLLVNIPTSEQESPDEWGSWDQTHTYITFSYLVSSNVGKVNRLL